MSNNKKRLGFIKIIILMIICVLTGIGVGLGLKKGDDVLGLIGGIIGVMGAFGLYKYQSYKENKDENDTNFNIMKDLLIYTISETDKMVYFMIQIYMKLYISNLRGADKSSLGYKILKAYIEDQAESPIIYIEQTYKRGTFEGMVESLGVDDIGHDFFDSSIELNALEKIQFHLIKSDYNKTREDLITEFRTVENKKYIIYDKSWCNYMHNINCLEFEDLKVIIQWLNIINKPIYNIDNKRKELIKELKKLDDKLELLKKIDSSSLSKDEEDNHNFKIHDVSREIYLKQIHLKRLKIEVMQHICQFIHYRDNTINMLKNKFEYDEFKTSTEKIREKFNKL